MTAGGSAESGYVECTWFTNGKLEQHTFHEDDLQDSDPRPPSGPISISLI